MMKTQIASFLFLIVLVFSKNNLKVQQPINPCTYQYLQNVSEITPTPENKLILGDAAVYAVLAGSTTTNAGVTTVVGSLGVSPSTAIAGTAINLIAGAFHAGDPHSLLAQTALTKAYNDLAGRPGAKDMSGTDLAGITLKAGIYKYNLSVFLTAGTLTFDAEGNPDAVWIFQVGTTLITAVGSKVIMINGGNPLNIYWQIGTSVTIGTSASMLGNLVAYANISFGTYSTLHGRALARSGAVTMLSNVIEIQQCRA